MDEPTAADKAAADAVLGYFGGMGFESLERIVRLALAKLIADAHAEEREAVRELVVGLCRELPESGLMRCVVCGATAENWHDRIRHSDDCPVPHLKALMKEQPDE